MVKFFFFSSRRRHTRYWRDWSSDVCSSDLTLVHETEGGITSGAIVETEAYLCFDDPACHAYMYPNMRNRTIFGRPALAYVYLVYGVHKMLNVNCEEEGKGSAVLIRDRKSTRLNSSHANISYAV